MKDWKPDLSASDGPRYRAIADCIEADIKSGHLSPGDRLPAQRDLARQIGLDFTTVARGYTEARRRGLISSLVGSGTFVSLGDVGGQATLSTPRRQRVPTADLSMNLPPEPSNSALLARMQEGLTRLSGDVLSLMRYQDLSASGQDKDAALLWLADVGVTSDSERLVLAPGAQPAIAAILRALSGPGDTILCEEITYPGIRAVCTHQGLTLVGLACDGSGPIPAALEEACRHSSPKALYLNPTIHNPTGKTIPTERRLELITIARHYGVQIIEDDVYGHIASAPPPTFNRLAPEITWYVSSLSKTLGAGLRLAYVLAPEKHHAWDLNRLLRTTNVMASPLTIALATQWIEDGTARDILDFVRREAAYRQSLAASALEALSYDADPSGFCLWLRLEDGWTRSTFAGHMRDQAIGIVESDAFTISGTPQEAVRICLGGPIGREELRHALELIAHRMQTPPHKSSAFF